MSFKIRKLFGGGDLKADLADLPLTHDVKATKDDIFYCFRLILGRLPDAAEWPGHSARAGTDLSAVVASYVGSLEFSRRKLGQRNPEALPTKADVEGHIL